MKPTKQRGALRQLLHHLPLHYPGCGICVFGSVMRGTERPNSDLDMFAVIAGNGAIQLRQGKREHLGDLGQYVDDDICVDIAILPAETLAKELARRPWQFWFFARSEVLHDPADLARPLHDMAARYFDTHPAAEAVWQRNAETCQRLKPQLKQNPDCGIILPALDEVMRQAKEAADREEPEQIAQQSVAPLPSAPRTGPSEGAR